MDLYTFIEEVKGNARVELVVKDAGFTISIDLSMVDAMRRWGWTVTGEFGVKRFEHIDDGAVLIATQSNFSGPGSTV